MANRIPLIVDRDDSNKLKELPIGDNLDLTGSGITGAGMISATGLTLAGVNYNPFSGSWNDLADKPTVAATTTELTEGTNQYFTNERVDDRVNAILREGSGIDITYDDLNGTITIAATGGGGGGAGGSGLVTDLTGLASSNVLKWNTTAGQDNNGAWVNSFINYSEIVGTPSLAAVATTGSYNNLANKPDLVNDISDLSDVDTQGTPPTPGQVLKWDGLKWAPANDATSGGGGLNADTLDGFDSPYFLDYNNLTNRPTLFDGNFTSIVGLPTTLSGYGITDSISANQSYTQNGSVTFNSDAGITVGTNNNIKLRVDNAVIIESTVDEQDLDIKVKPITGVETAIKIDTGTKRVGIFDSNPSHKLTVAGDVNATSFIGSGASLTGITLSQILAGGSEVSDSVSFGNVTPYTTATYNLGASNNVYSNVYATNFHGSGANLTNIPFSSLTSVSIDYTGSTITNKPTIPTNNNQLTNGAGYLANLSTTSITTLSDVSINSPQESQVIKYVGGIWTNAAGGESVGNFTFSSGIIDTDDSSGITITPAVTTSSDLTVQNDLVVQGSITADSIVSTGTGVPTIESASSINLSASDRVTVTQSPINLASFTTNDRNNLTATNGDMIYNTTTNKFQGYANGAWVDLH
jgi:cytoskeletal protein CcmA (bactofilin family)